MRSSAALSPSLLPLSHLQFVCVYVCVLFQLQFALFHIPLTIYHAKIVWASALLHLLCIYAKSDGAIIILLPGFPRILLTPWHYVNLVTLFK